MTSARGQKTESAMAGLAWPGGFGVGRDLPGQSAQSRAVTVESGPDISIPVMDQYPQRD